MTTQTFRALMVSFLAVTGCYGASGGVSTDPNFSSTGSSGVSENGGTELSEADGVASGGGSSGGSSGSGSSGSSESDNSGSGSSGSGSGSGSGSNSGSGSGAFLPCDVEAVLRSRCQSCHSPSLKSGGIALVTHDDLSASSPLYPSMRIYDRVVARITATSGMMPPSGSIPAAEIAIVQNWVSAGAARTECKTDSSGPGSGQTQPPPPPPPAPTVCTSNTRWTGGNDGSSLMNPGMACINCHRGDEGPSFRAGGTVYPTIHEPDRCNGVNGGVVVELTDSTGRIATANVNSAGNFNFGSAQLTFPVKVRLLEAGRVRVMGSPAPHGDCNLCHTVQGANGAPGRIMAP